MFQINVSGPEINPGEIPNPPEHNKKVHLQSFSCTLVHKLLIQEPCKLVHKPLIL